MGTRIDSLRLTATHPGAFVATLVGSAAALLGICALGTAAMIVIAPLLLEAGRVDPSTCDLDAPSEGCTDLLDFQYGIPNAQQVAATRAQLRLAEQIATEQRQASLDALGLQDHLPLPHVLAPDDPREDPEEHVLAEQWMHLIEEPLPAEVVRLIAERDGLSEAQVRADLDLRLRALTEAALEEEREIRGQVLTPAWEQAETEHRIRANRSAVLAMAALPLGLFGLLLLPLALLAGLLARRYGALPIVVSGRALQLGGVWHPLHGCAQGTGEVLMIEADGTELVLPPGYTITRGGWTVLREALEQGLRASAVAEDRSVALHQLQQLREHG